MTPSVTIGIPFYGTTPEFKLAVRSVFAQTEQNWELVLYHDGGGDHDLALANAIRDPRVRVVSDGENFGVARRLNQITELARADVVVRMDADDIMIPRRIQSQLELLRARPDVDLVASSAYVIDTRNQPVSIWRSPEISDDPSLFFTNQVITHPTITVRKDWALKFPYDPTLRRAQDKELFLRAHPFSKFHVIDEPLLCYRFIGTFDSAKYRDQRARERQFLRDYGRARLGLARTLRGYGASLAKDGLFRVADAAGLADRLRSAVTESRSSELPQGAEDFVNQTVNEIRMTPVPGWH